MSLHRISNGKALLRIYVRNQMTASDMAGRHFVWIVNGTHFWASCFSPLKLTLILRGATRKIGAFLKVSVET